MNPIINQQWTTEDRARYGIRSIDDFTNEELARLQEKLVGWMSQRAPHPKNSRHRAPFVMKRRTDGPAYGVMPEGVEPSQGRETS